MLSNKTKMVFFSQGIDEVATVKLEEAFKKFPYDANTYNHLEILYFEQKDFNKAEEIFKKSSPLRPNHGIAYYNLGNLFK